MSPAAFSVKVQIAYTHPVANIALPMIGTDLLVRIALLSVGWSTLTDPMYRWKQAPSKPRVKRG